MLPCTALNLPDADVRYYPSFLQPGEARSLFDALRAETTWEQRSVNLMGLTIPQPRLIAWHGDPEASYSYSGLTVQPTPWTTLLTSLKAKVEEVVPGFPFNSVLLNLYRNGKDSIAWHSDDEPELGENPTMASVSLGAVRKFSLKHKVTKEVHDINLASGSLLVMAGRTQTYWMHQVPKTKRPVGERINLTFRCIRGTK